MKKQKHLYIYLEDKDQRIFSIEGPIDHDTADDWLDIGNSAVRSGRNLQIIDFWEEDLNGYVEHAKSRGFVKVYSNEIISSPRDRSAEYKKTLPKYAQNADREKLVKLLCKGKCGKVVWAELNSTYPGKEALKKASMGEFQARCLKCGSVAKDNYNWYRD
jgi:hypothetical protein